MKAKLLRPALEKSRRIICISDIHGRLDLLKRVLELANYTAEDYLLLLGDFYAKGPMVRETLDFVMALSQRPGVYALRGNCDAYYPDFDARAKEWLEDLPHIIETEDFVFVHSGLGSGPLEGQKAAGCVKNDAFMEKAPVQEKTVICGHWPTINYCHEVPCFNPVFNTEKRIISIDGGTVLKDAGQLNALVIQDGRFSFLWADSLEKARVLYDVPGRQGSYNTTWNDRHVQRQRDSTQEGWGVYAHLATGKSLELPDAAIWTDMEGKSCECDLGTDHFIGARAGEAVFVVRRHGSLAYVKKDGFGGWMPAKALGYADNTGFFASEE